MVDGRAIEQASAIRRKTITINALAKLIQDEIKLRKNFFPDSILNGHGWDVLLNLQTIADERQDASITAMSTLGGMTATTGLRWIEVLCSKELVVIANDVDDVRQKYLILTDQGKKRMETYLKAVAELRQLALVG